MKKMVRKGILALALSGVLFGCESKNECKLRPAGFENVRLGGELAERVNRNFDRMETELYQPENVYWTEEQSNGWPADKEGRTILALVLDARALGRTPVYLDELIALLPEHLNEKGYLGTIHEGVDEQQLSGHGWLLRGLCEYYEWTGDRHVLEIGQGIAENLFLPVLPYVANYPIDPDSRVTGAGDMSGTTQNTVDGWRLSSDVGCVFIGMEGLIHYYKHDRDPRIRALIDELIALYLRIDLKGIEAQTHASLTALRGLLRYAEITADPTLIPEVEKRWTLYKQYGMTENFENYNWFERYDTWTEPCAIVDSYLVAVQLWMKTRDPQYLSDAERIYLNGIACTQRANGGFGCDKPVGVGFDALSIHADEAHWCCTMRGGEGLGRAAEYSYFVAADTVFVPFYRENGLRLEDLRFAMEQHTDYPFGSQVEFTIEESPDTLVTVALSAPDYLHVENLRVNGESVSTAVRDGFMAVTRRFEPGDRIVLDYSFDAEWVGPDNRDIGDSAVQKAVYGPLVLGAPAGKTIGTDTDAPLRKTEDGCRFVIEGTQDTLAPLYHLLDPNVSSATGFRREVLVRKP